MNNLLMNFQNTPQLRLAHDFVEYTGKNIFLTGKAGTGKTTFLHQIRKNSFKRMVVVAPTGVAAINASGVTIHSFFQLAFGPYLPGYQTTENVGDQKLNNNSSAQRFSRQKINIIRSLDLLVIDEISMVRSDMLDGIDATLRRFRRSKEPFGGVQLLMIGDLRQLSPVVKDDEWTLLQKHYQTPYFFSSNALQKTQFISIELTQVFRQSDDRFIGLLNQVRGNKLTSTTIKELNKRYLPDFNDHEGYITLTTHNHKAHQINDDRLSELKVKQRKFKATISGNFPEYIYPTDEVLSLKIGAQVMFVKNDPSPEKLFYNGKIGKIVAIDLDSVSVKCEVNEDLIHVSALEWNNIKYTLNEESKEINESIEGVFKQIPLKLAWAITIHKSQGLTFEKAIIDAEAAFAHGQVYVALSRCKTLEGMVLSTPIREHSVKNDSSVDHFSDEVEKNQPDENQLQEQKYQFQQQLLLDLFQFENLQINIWALLKIMREHKISLREGFVAAMNVMTDGLKKTIMEVSSSFQIQLKRLLAESKDVENNPSLQDRIKKGATYFSKELNEKLFSILDNIDIDTDNKQVKKNVSEQISRILEEAHFKKGCLESCRSGFIMKDYLINRAKAAILAPEKKKSRKTLAPVVLTESKRPDLYAKLKQWRDDEASEKNLPHYMIIPAKTMIELSNKVPTTLSQLKKVKGIGKKKVEQYGTIILEMILNNIPEDQRNKFDEEESEEIAVVKKTTYDVTLELWKKDMSIEEIAQERDLAISTIEGHLAKFVKSGEVEMEALVDPEKIAIIQELFQECGPINLSEAREILGEEYSYGELRIVRNSITFEEQNEEPEDLS
jgi:transposase